MANYVKLDNHFPFSCYYAFLDCDEYLADQLFIRYEVPVKFRQEFASKNSRYRVIFCKIRKKHEENFLKALSEMYNKMLLRGFCDYREFCEDFNAMLKKAGENV